METEKTKLGVGQPLLQVGRHFHLFASAELFHQNEAKKVSLPVYGTVGNDLTAHGGIWEAFEQDTPLRIP